MRLSRVVLPLTLSLTRPRALAPLGMEPAWEILSSAADGDVAAAIEAGLLALGAGGAALAARNLLRSEPALEAATARMPISDRVGIDVDLGDDGEPRGITRLYFKPRLPRSELIRLQLRVPLGLVIEEDETNGDIVVTGALPGYSSFGQVEPGDLLRGGRCGCADVAAGHLGHTDGHPFAQAAGLHNRGRDVLRHPLCDRIVRAAPARSYTCMCPYERESCAAQLPATAVGVA